MAFPSAIQQNTVQSCNTYVHRIKVSFGQGLPVYLHGANPEDIVRAQ